MLVTPDAIDRYRQADRALAVAAFAQSHLPRGKGAVPRWLGRAIGRKPTFLITRHGAHLVMAPHAWDVYATMARHNYSWDYHDFEWCVNGMPKSGVFYDIGANVGYFSVEMAMEMGSAIRVVAFEPQKPLADAITASIILNHMDNLKVVHAMVGDAPRQSELYLAPASIHASAVEDSGRPCVGIVQAQMVTIDDLVENAEIPPPDMVKIDVEGSEHLVFQGAHRTFRTHMPHIFVEYIADFDLRLRIRGQLEKLVEDCPYLELFGHASRSKKSGRSHAWFRMRTEADWPLVDSLFLKNAKRHVRNPLVFEP